MGVGEALVRALRFVLEERREGNQGSLCFLLIIALSLAFATVMKSNKSSMLHLIMHLEAEKEGRRKDGGKEGGRGIYRSTSKYCKYIQYSKKTRC